MGTCIKLLLCKKGIYSEKHDYGFGKGEFNRALIEIYLRKYLNKLCERINICRKDLK